MRSIISIVHNQRQEMAERERQEHSSPQQAMEGQTFLFADIRGYTTFTKDRGADEAARLASRFTVAAHDAVEARGGRPLEIRGDQVLATFLEASQAIRAAVEMQESFVEEMQDDPSLHLQVGVGLDSGVAVPGPSGYHGTVLNTAARLCSAAQPGEILVTRRVAQEAAGRAGVTFEECAPLALKGLGVAVEPLRVIGINPGRVGSEVAFEQQTLPFELDPLIPVFACRGADLRWLRGNWRLARRGRGRLVFLTGPRGIGKTRLSSEAAHLAFREGACVAYASMAAGDALVALRSAVSSLAPTMFVLDDIGTADPEMVRGVADVAEQVPEHPVLLVCEVRDSALNRSDIEQLVDRFGGNGERVRTLKPLDPEGIMEVAVLYAGKAAADLPIHSVLANTGGVPQRVHEAVSLWARERAVRRLHESGNRVARESSELQSMESDLALSVTDLELAEGRALLLEGMVSKAACPFKGLASFDISDADDFFGRERLVGALVARLAVSPFLGVLGPSGCGKSSLVRAGFLPALDRGVLPGSESWRRVVMRPGVHPLDELRRGLDAVGLHRPIEAQSLVGAAAQLESHQRLLVVVDQFEEVFTSCSDESERVTFIDELTSAIDTDDSVACVIVIRADFYEHCPDYPRLSELLARNHVLVGAMNEEELHRAVELPAR